MLAGIGCHFRVNPVIEQFGELLPKHVVKCDINVIAILAEKLQQNPKKYAIKMSDVKYLMTQLPVYLPCL